MKQDAIRATSWGILTDAVESGQILHTIDGLHIHGNHIYDIGGYNDSIGLGISIHEVVSSEIDGGALIENNRFSDIHDGKWAGAAGLDVPGMGVFTHEQTTVYDIVYKPVKTDLINKAKEKNCKIIFGYEMLLGQAIRSFEIWLDKKAPYETMKRSILGGF